MNDKKCTREKSEQCEFVSPVIHFLPVEADDKIIEILSTDANLIFIFICFHAIMIVDAIGLCRHSMETRRKLCHRSIKLHQSSDTYVRHDAYYVGCFACAWLLWKFWTEPSRHLKIFAVEKVVWNSWVDNVRDFMRAFKTLFYFFFLTKLCCSLETISFKWTGNYRVDLKSARYASH